MAPTRFRFGAADRATYGEGPNDGWYQIDVFALDQLEGGVIEKFEEVGLGGTGYTVMGTLPASLLAGYHRAIRALMWLATLANGQDLKWADFHPDLRTAEYVRMPDTDTAEDTAEGNRAGPADNRATRRATKKTAGSKTRASSGR